MKRKTSFRAARSAGNRTDSILAADAQTPQELCAELKIPGLSAYGMTEAQVAEAVDKGQRSSSMKGNPVQLTEAELKEVLVRSM